MGMQHLKPEPEAVAEALAAGSEEHRESEYKSKSGWW